MNNIGFEQIANNTQNVAHSIDFNLSSKSLEEVKNLVRQDLNDLSIVPSQKVISVLNKSILDGRFIDSWQNNLDEVATQLNIALTANLRQELNSMSIEVLYQDNLNEEKLKLL